MQLIRSLWLRNLLSFPPDMEPFELQPLNVLIGPNGSGKTNLIEALELLRATPTDFAAAIRAGGGMEEWRWKGENENGEPMAEIDVATGIVVPSFSGLGSDPNEPLHYYIGFTDLGDLTFVHSESVWTAGSDEGHEERRFYYRTEGPTSVILMKGKTSESRRSLQEIPRMELDMDQSILKQHRELLDYPEITTLQYRFSRIRAFREWAFGPGAPSRAASPIGDTPDTLSSDARNLALAVSEIQHRGGSEFDAAMQRFLPRYERASTRIIGNTVLLYLHEKGLEKPIPATRVSDGTLRFLAILASLFAPSPPSLLCIEEPELGMHPDAVALLGELLVDASSRTQLVVTTHSDALLSALGGQVESVLVCENDGRGTAVNRLDAERLAFWLRDYTLGDVWRMGEIGGNP